MTWIDGFQPGDVFYDVGAACGLLSMYAALLPGIDIYAFEPKAPSFGVLVEHLAMNGMGSRVFPLCVALSEVTRRHTPLFILNGRWVLAEIRSAAPRISLALHIRYSARARWPTAWTT